VVHVEEVRVAEPFDVLVQGDRLLDVAVLLLVAAPDGVVNEDAVDRVVVVGGDDGLFEVFLVDFAEVEVEAAGKRRRGVSEGVGWFVKGSVLLLLAGLLGPLGVLHGGRVVVGKEGYQGRPGSIRALDGGQSLPGLGEEFLGYCIGEDDLAGLGDLGVDGGSSHGERGRSGQRWTGKVRWLAFAHEVFPDVLVLFYFSHNC
jgi:hypothetical protein